MHGGSAPLSRCKNGKRERDAKKFSRHRAKVAHGRPTVRRNFRITVSTPGGNVINVTTANERPGVIILHDTHVRGV